MDNRREATDALLLHLHLTRTFEVRKQMLTLVVTSKLTDISSPLI